MRELLETVLAITLAVLGATAMMGAIALLFCALSLGACWIAYARWRRRGLSQKREKPRW